MGSLVPNLDELVESLVLLPVSRVIFAGVPFDAPGTVELVDVDTCDFEQLVTRLDRWRMAALVVDGVIGDGEALDVRAGIGLDRHGKTAGRLVCKDCGDIVAVDPVAGRLFELVRDSLAARMGSPPPHR